MCNVVFWMFGLNVRLVFGARRTQLDPEAVKRMLRPNVTCLSQISHLAICILPGRPGRSQFD
jgi:putative flippase GtrA